MPTQVQREALTRAGAEAVVAAAVTGADAGGDGVGIELELLAIHRGPPTRRLRIDAPVAAAPSLRSLLPAGEGPQGRHAPAREGVQLSYEPGGQVELATRCHDHVGAALDALATATADAAAVAADADVHLVAAGQDLWHDVGAVPQQLARDRYRAMAAYLAGRGPHGAVMMRHTCALQLNLDLGSGAEREARWLVANLLAPVATATFATSPDPAGSVRSRRSLAWQGLDPTRTGFPDGILTGTGDLVDQMTRFAMAADVLLVRTSDGARPGRAGWRFGTWIDQGHPVHGRPTAEDLREHLSTLFPEVRPRGFIELRSIDSVPARDRSATVVLLAGAITDPQARDRILQVLEPHRVDLPQLLTRCATLGVRDPELCALAVEVWSFAREGAARLRGVAHGHLAAVDAFIDRYTVRGRCPGDELLDRFRRDPAEAMRWSSEPLPSLTETRT